MRGSGVNYIAVALSLMIIAVAMREKFETAFGIKGSVWWGLLIALAIAVGIIGLVTMRRE